MPAAKRKADDEVPGATTAAPAERVVTDPVEVSGTTAPPAAADEPENQVVDHIALLRQFEGIQDDGPMGDGQLEEDEALEHEQSRNQLEALNEESLRRCLELTQSRARDRLRVLHGVKHLEAQRDALTTMLNALLKGESNSALLLGPSGWGKTAILDSSLEAIVQERASPFYMAKLDATLHPTDKVALRELVRQLVDSGALQGLYQSELEDLQEEVGEEQGEDVAGAENEDDDDSAVDESDGEGETRRGVQQERRRRKVEQLEAAKQAAESSILSSVTNMTTHLLSLLSNPKTSKANKPILVLLENMDEFALRPKQALLYVLLDAVQSSSYRPGLLVLATATRLDTIDLLEKRVKSRFSHRILHCRPTDSLDGWKDTALSPLLEPESKGKEPVVGWRAWRTPWNQACTDSLGSDAVAQALQHEWELNNNVRTLYKCWYRLLSKLTPSNPLPTPRIALEALNAEHRDTTLQTLLELTVPETALLISAVRLCYGRGMETVTYQMLLHELRTDYVKNSKQGHQFFSYAWAESLTKPSSKTSCKKAFRQLLALSLLVPETVVTSLAVPREAARPWPSASRSASLEFVKVRLAVPVPKVLSAIQSPARAFPVHQSLIQWCLFKLG